MTFVYASYSYLYPPRPERKIAPDTVGTYEALGWWAQVKRNGDCTMIFAREETVLFMNRHNLSSTRWTPKQYHLDFFRGEPYWNVYAAERIDDTLYIFDQVVKDGTHLVGMTFETRQHQLYSKWPVAEEEDELRVTEFLSVAKSHVADFRSIFDRLGPNDEGLVMKHPNAALKPCFRDNQNGGWQVKARRATKNYPF